MAPFQCSFSAKVLLLGILMSQAGACSTDPDSVYLSSRTLVFEHDLLDLRVCVSIA